MIKNFFTTAADGKNYSTKFYNVDAIISVGYRVKSRVATQFRIWAIQRLREYVVKGFVLDDEQMPLLEDGGIDAFRRREVLPHAPDVWYDPSSVKTGHEVSFTRYFYKPQPLRTLEEISADILALEKETEGLLQKILQESGRPT